MKNYELAKLKSRLKAKQLRRLRTIKSNGLQLLRRLDALRALEDKLQSESERLSTAGGRKLANKHARVQTRLDIVRRESVRIETSAKPLRAPNEDYDLPKIIRNQNAERSIWFSEAHKTYIDKESLKAIYGKEYEKQKFFLEGKAQALLDEMNQLCAIYSSTKLNSKAHGMTHGEFKADSKTLQKSLRSALTVLKGRDTTHSDALNSIFGTTLSSAFGELPKHVLTEPMLTQIVLESLLKSEKSLCQKVVKDDFHAVRKRFIGELLRLLSRYLYTVTSSKNSNLHHLVMLLTARVQTDRRTSVLELASLPQNFREFNEQAAAVKKANCQPQKF